MKRDQEKIKKMGRPSSPTTSARPELTKLGPYVLGKTLGVGSNGRVKIGIHGQTGNRVAIKIIPKVKNKADGTGTATQKETNSSTKLEREIAIMKLIQHPCIMSLYDVYETNDELYLVLEYVEGGELFDYLVKRGRLPEPEALRFFQQIIAGVDFCHKHLICHRDLKPENLLLDSKKNIKIADFGMASLQRTGKLLETSCGSPHYASPEVIKGIKYDGATADIWSCGVILFALLTGTLPFDDENIRRLLQKVKTGVFNIPSFVPPDAADLIRRMMTVEPSRRISMAEVMEHPWFTKTPLKESISQGIMKQVPTNDPEFQTITNGEVIDEEILESFRVLGWTREQIVQALTETTLNYEKMFYWLLFRRKQEFLENYEPESTDDISSDPAGSSPDLTRPRRRMGSTQSIYLDRTSLSTQDVSNRASRPGSAISSPRPTTRRAENQRVKSYQPSPLSSPPPDDVDIAAAKLAALQALSGGRPVSPSTQQQATLNPLFAAPNPNSQRFTSPATTSAPTLPQVSKTQRQNIQVDTAKLAISTNQLDSGIGQSPNSQAKNATSPKQKWFNGLFNFKPDTFEFEVQMNTADANRFVERFLLAEGVRYQESAKGGLKCKVEEGHKNMAGAKFRISVFVSSRVDYTLVECLQQQGSATTFRIVSDGLKKAFADSKIH